MSVPLESIPESVIGEGYGKYPSSLQIFNAILHSLFSASA